MQKAKGEINNQFLITRFSIIRRINNQFLITGFRIKIKLLYYHYSQGFYQNV
ncbi:photosystem II protein D1 [Microcystis sp. 0824]|nr:photosystem II protein D1 [Microcystis sp. 0824]